MRFYAALFAILFIGAVLSVSLELVLKSDTRCIEQTEV
jgi:hypothetical protein